MIDLRNGDSLEVLKGLPDNSVDSIVTDPPYGLAFMNKKWDYDIPSVEIWRECLRVLKPGGHLLSFGGTRTYHRIAVAIEDAGFEIRDSIHWIYGSGFPKSMNVSKAMDKAVGAEREVVAASPYSARRTADMGYHGGAENEGTREITAPATPEAEKWDGWGTALKPAHEPIVMARKPLVGTVAANVLEYGTGALNIDGNRVKGNDKISRVTGAGILGGSSEGWNRPWKSDENAISRRQTRADEAVDKANELGRWPANVVFDEFSSNELDKQSGITTSKSSSGRNGKDNSGSTWKLRRANDEIRGHDDKGGASRFFTQADFGPKDWPFFYQPKASKKERHSGLDDLPSKFSPTMGNGIGDKPQDPETATLKKNIHPTVKPVQLMKHLVKLVTPPQGVVLDPFMGSGSTGIACVLEGFDFIGIEIDSDYLKIAQTRIKHWESKL